MNIQITCNGLEHTDVLDAQIRKQLEKIMTFLNHDRDPSTVQIVLTMHPTHAHNEVHVHLASPHYKVDAQREGYDMNALINETIDIAYDELLKQKSKRIHDRNNSGTPHRGV